MNPVYDLIQQKLLDGELAAGSNLSEVELAAEAGISRTPVREALVRLRSEGVIDRLPRFGWFVRILDRDELVELYEVRELLECHAVAKAAEAADLGSVAAIKANLDETRAFVRQLRHDRGQVSKPEARARGNRLDVMFHRLLLKASDNHWIWRASEQFGLLGRLHALKGVLASELSEHELYASSDSEKFFQRELLRLIHQTLLEHHRIYHAVRRHDGELARRLMAGHIRRGLDSSLRGLEKRKKLLRAQGTLASALIDTGTAAFSRENIPQGDP